MSFPYSIARVFWLVPAACMALPLVAKAETWRVSQDGTGELAGRDEKPILAAIAKARAIGGEIVIGPGIYQINQSLKLDQAKNLTLRGEGDVVLKLAPALVTELAQPAAVGDGTLELKSPEGLKPGLRLRIMAPGEIVPLTGGPKPSFDATIASIAGTKVTLSAPLRFPAPVDTRVVNENDLNLVSIWGEGEKITLLNLTLDGALDAEGLRQATHNTRCGVWVQGRYDYLKGPIGPKPRGIRIENCHFRNFHGRGIAIYSAEDCVVENCIVENVLDEGINLDHFVERCRVVGNQVRKATVGIEMNDTNDCTIVENSIEDCRFGIRLWRYCKIEALNLRNEVRSNHLRGIGSVAVEFKAGTKSNLATDNVLRVPEAAKTDPGNHFRDSGEGNRMENNRVQSDDVSSPPN